PVVVSCPARVASCTDADCSWTLCCFRYRLCPSCHLVYVFSLNQPATPAIYTLSLHDALPIYWRRPGRLPDRRHRLLLVLLRVQRSEEHTSELQSLTNLVCRLLLEKKKTAPTQALRMAATAAAVTRN